MTQAELELDLEALEMEHQPREGCLDCRTCWSDSGHPAIWPCLPSKLLGKIREQEKLFTIAVKWADATKEALRAACPKSDGDDLHEHDCVAMLKEQRAKIEKLQALLADAISLQAETQTQLEKQIIFYRGAVAAWAVVCATDSKPHDARLFWPEVQAQRAKKALDYTAQWRTADCGPHRVVKLQEVREREREREN